MANVEKGASFGPWKDDNFSATAHANAGIGADAGLPDTIRFRSSIAKLVRRRLVVQGDTDEPNLLSVFLLEPSPPNSAGSYDPKRVPRLDNGNHPISGCIWFVGAGPGSGHFIPAIHDDDDALFDFITDTLELGSTPAIVFDPAHPEPHLRHYPDGLDHLDQFEDLSIASAEVTIESVTAVIHDTYREKMITPGAQPKLMSLWKNGSKWLPRRNAEHLVQSYLEIALNAAFPLCTVRSEPSVPEGRIDIEIVESDQVDRAKFTQHGILELKVLRSYRETGKAVTEKSTMDWIKSGVEQAAAYRDRKSARWGALICFDMRTDDTKSFKSVRAQAKSLGICLRRWFLFGSAKQLRSAGTANYVSGPSEA